MIRKLVTALARWRRSWPAPVNRTIDAVMARLPEPVALRLNPAKYGFTAADVPAPPAAPTTPIRLYIAPVNFAGQGFRWARAAETLPGVGAVSMQYRLEKGFDFPSDNPVPVRVFSRSQRWQRAQFEAVASGFSHVIFEAERPIFGALFGQSPVREAAALRERGVAVAMLSHGSDLRLPSRHRDLDRWSPFHDTGWELIPVLEEQALKNRAVLAEIGAPVFVSTPDLLLDWPDAHWLPVTVDTAAWSVAAPPLQRAVPRVVHAPTNAVIKGSDLIEPIVEGLADEGLIEYVRVEGVPAAQMPALYASADVVLDQFRIGNYGAAAIEAMAAGRVVIGYLHDQVRDHVTEQTGRQVPIVQASVDSLGSVLRDIATNPEAFRASARAGVEFAAAVHDGAASAAVLRPFLETP